MAQETLSTQSPAARSALRGARRALGLVGWSLCCWLGYEFSGFATTRVGRAGAKPQARWLKRWCGGCLRILGVRLVSRSSEAPPSAPFLLVSNHLGYLDIIVYGALTGACFLAKAEVRSWPIVGFLSARLGTLYVRRESPRDAARALAQIGEKLEASRVVAVFPEATSSDGAQVLPFHATLFDAAIKGDVPTLCAALRYETPAGFDPGEWVCWWRDMTFPDHVWGLLTLPRVTAEVNFGKNLNGFGDRKALAAAASHEVVALHENLTQGVATTPHNS